MTKLAFECINNPTHVFKHRSNMTDGIGCPICKGRAKPYPVNNEQYAEIPFHDDVVKKQSAKNLNISATLDMNTDNLSAKLKAIAKHAEALAKELDAIDAEQSTL